MTEEPRTREEHRRESLGLLQDVRIGRSRPYPEYTELGILVQEALTHAILALTAPDDVAMTAPEPKTVQDVAPITYGLIGTFVYDGLEYDLGSSYVDRDGDRWRFTDRMGCGMPRLHCTRTSALVWGLPDVLKEFGPLRDGLSGLVLSYASTQGDEEPRAYCTVCGGVHGHG